MELKHHSSKTCNKIQLTTHTYTKCNPQSKVVIDGPAILVNNLLENELINNNLMGVNCINDPGKGTHLIVVEWVGGNGRCYKYIAM